MGQIGSRANSCRVVVAQGSGLGTNCCHVCHLAPCFQSCPAQHAAQQYSLPRTQRLLVTSSGYDMRPAIYCCCCLWPACAVRNSAVLCCVVQELEITQMRQRLRAERGVRKACEAWLQSELKGRVSGGRKRSSSSSRSET
jgi:hypothetical protein